MEIYTKELEKYSSNLLINTLISKNTIILFLLCIFSMTGCTIINKGQSSVTKTDNFKDAVPKVEPLLSGPNKPYTVRGKRYVPDTREIPYRRQGTASWYGKQFHGKSTSSGEKYDMYAMSAAHTILPIPSYVRVTNTNSGRSVIVRVNDRGPFVDNRVIDLSYAAATRLGFTQQGTAKVVVERIMPADIAKGKIPNDNTGSTTPPPTLPSPSGSKISGGFFIQIGVYSQQDNARKIENQLSSQNSTPRSKLRTLYENGLYKVYAGPYSTGWEAQSVGNNIQHQTGAKILILDRR